MAGTSSSPSLEGLSPGCRRRCRRSCSTTAPQSTRPLSSRLLTRSRSRSFSRPLFNRLGGRLSPRSQRPRLPSLCQRSRLCRRVSTCRRRRLSWLPRRGPHRVPLRLPPPTRSGGAKLTWQASARSCRRRSASCCARRGKRRRRPGTRCRCRTTRPSSCARHPRRRPSSPPRSPFWRRHLRTARVRSPLRAPGPPGARCSRCSPAHSPRRGWRPAFPLPPVTHTPLSYGSLTRGRSRVFGWSGARPLFFLMDSEARLVSSLRPAFGGVSCRVVRGVGLGVTVRKTRSVNTTAVCDTAGSASTPTVPSPAPRHLRLRVLCALAAYRPLVGYDGYLQQRRFIAEGNYFCG